MSTCPTCHGDGYVTTGDGDPQNAADCPCTYGACDHCGDTRYPAIPTGQVDLWGVVERLCARCLAARECEDAEIETARDASADGFARAIGEHGYPDHFDPAIDGADRADYCCDDCGDTSTPAEPTGEERHGLLIHRCRDCQDALRAEDREIEAARG